jgi:hypothetical protein
MNTFFYKNRTKLKMRKLSPEEFGLFRYDVMSTLTHTPDPFGSLLYTVNYEPCQELAENMSAKTGSKITPAHILNKMIAVAVAENPVFNQLVLGGSMYQMEGIHITNILLLPGKKFAQSCFVLRNPHLKPLETIQRESLAMMVERTKEAAAPRKQAASFLMRLGFKTGLYRLVSEKLAFSMGFQKGITSNIVLSNHQYGSPANFIVLKSLITPLKVPLLIHATVTEKRPFVENGTLTSKKTLILTVIPDHRIFYGIHLHQFGQSLERISSSPEKYLL